MRKHRYNGENGNCRRAASTSSPRRPIRSRQNVLFHNVAAMGDDPQVWRRGGLGDAADGRRLPSDAGQADQSKRSTNTFPERSPITRLGTTRRSVKQKVGRRDPKRMKFSASGFVAAFL